MVFFRLFRAIAQGLRAIAQGLREVALWLRHVSGDDAYERYLEHWRRHHTISGEAGENGTGESPLGRREFFRQRENERWNGIRRCC